MNPVTKILSERPADTLKYKCVIFDLDGTVYFGEHLADKANDVIDFARKNFSNIYFLTNNSAKSREQIFQKLKNLGIKLNLSELYTVSYAIPKYLRDNNYQRVYCIGTKELCHEIKDFGIENKSMTPDAIVVGFNPEFKLSDINELANIKPQMNYKLIVANRERAYPIDKNGYKHAGAGPIVAAVEELLNHKVDITIGKPNTELLKIITFEHNIAPDEILVVGDSYESDIKMAQNYGANGILISKNKVADCTCIKRLADLLEIWND